MAREAALARMEQSVTDKNTASEQARQQQYAAPYRSQTRCSNIV